VSKPQARTAAKRESILRAAMEIFGSRGYSGATLSEIAEQAGMTHAGVLHHFGSKENLLIAMLKYRDGVATNGVSQQEQVEGPAFLGHLVDTVNENVKRPGVVQTYTVISGEAVTDEHPAQEFVRDRLAGLRVKLQGVIGETTDRPADDPEVREAASTIIAVMDGLQIQWLLDPGSVDMARAVEVVIDELIERLATGEAAPPAVDRAARVIAAAHPG